jgi:hypothetical protein
MAEDKKVFCPFIDYDKAECMRREAPSRKLRKGPNARRPEVCATYRWWQTDDFKSVQICKIRREPTPNVERCELSFETCPLYRDKMGLPLTTAQQKELFNERETNKIKYVRRKA